jgi:peptidoglycan/LPS O-acetylase OafA/YrhL
MAVPRNNFTMIRLGLALAVVVSHAFSVTTGRLAEEPLLAATGFTLGEHAVNGFFAISGFLVTMSFDRRGWRDYAIARFLRIAPGLVVATLATAILIGVAMTRLPPLEYLGSSGLWRFVTATLATFKTNMALPGVFETNPLRLPMGTVWTLKYEVLCYLGVFALGSIGLLRSKAAALVIAAGFGAAIVILDLLGPDTPKGIETALRLPFIFALGGALYVWRDRAPISGIAVLAILGAAWFAGDTALSKALLFAATSYGVLWLALAPALVRHGYDPQADFSYGTYLYGWPVQQMLHALFPTAAALTLLVPAIAIALAVAALSWFGVERPALALKVRAVGRSTLTTSEPAAT